MRKQKRRPFFKMDKKNVVPKFRDHVFVWFFRFSFTKSMDYMLCLLILIEVKSTLMQNRLFT